MVVRSMQHEIYKWKAYNTHTGIIHPIPTKISAIHPHLLKLPVFSSPSFNTLTNTHADCPITLRQKKINKRRSLIKI